jgi:hypothetical protein
LKVQDGAGFGNFVTMTTTDSEVMLQMAAKYQASTRPHLSTF